MRRTVDGVRDDKVATAEHAFPGLWRGVREVVGRWRRARHWRCRRLCEVILVGCRCSELQAKRCPGCRCPSLRARECQGVASPVL